MLHTVTCIRIAREGHVAARSLGKLKCNHVLVRKYSFKLNPNRGNDSGRGNTLRNIGIAGGCMLTIPVVTFCLGTWQVRRREWKLNLIQVLEEKTTAEPIELPYNLDELDELEYRKIRVTGKFDHSKELYVRPRSLLRNGEETGGGLISSGSQTGAYVVTPFHLSDRDAVILVNRGWVSRKRMDPKTRPEGQVKENVELVGIVRQNEKKGPFMPANDENDRFWLSRDVDAMATLCGTLPVFLDADSASTVRGGPIGGQTRVSLRNEHLSYIFTWYTLCAATSFLWYRKYLHGKPLM